MSLAQLIHKKRSVAVATAIPAIFATHGQKRAGTVARIATVAVASLTEAKRADENSSRNSTDSSSKPSEQQTTSHCWLLHFPDREPLEMACCPEATYAEILERHPDALAAEPFTPTSRDPSAPLTFDEEAAIRAWLAQIGETDPETIGEVIDACRHDEGARRYFLSRAGEVTSCAEYQHLRRPGGMARYCCGRADLPPAYGEGHPLRQIPADGGARRVAFERWR